MEKHIGFYVDNIAFENDRHNLREPWVAYIGSEGEYKVEYSSQEILGGNAKNVAEDLSRQIKDIQNSFITLTEDEYEKLVTNPGLEIFITPLGGEKYPHKYDPSVFYYTYDPKDLPTED